MSKKISPDQDKSTDAPNTERKTAVAKNVSQAARQTHSGEKKGLGTRLENFKEFLVLSRAELRKVTWPTWKETRATSLVVFGFVAVMALFLSLVDLVFSGLIGLILS